MKGKTGHNSSATCICWCASDRVHSQRCCQVGAYFVFYGCAKLTRWKLKRWPGQNEIQPPISFTLQSKFLVTNCPRRNTMVVEWLVSRRMLDPKWTAWWCYRAPSNRSFVQMGFNLRSALKFIGACQWRFVGLKYVYWISIVTGSLLILCRRTS